MSELGLTLRKAREELGLSLEQITETTKIRKPYLEAIEEGNYKALPGSFYARAFVKNYAEAVGLDPDEVLNYFKDELPGTAPEPQQEITVARSPRRASASSESSERFGRLGFSVLMWSFLLLILVLVYVFVIKRDDTGNRTADNTTTIENSNNSIAGNQQGTEGQPGAGGNDSTATNEENSTEGSNSSTEVETPTVEETTGSSTSINLVEKSTRNSLPDKYEVGPVGSHTVTVKVSGGYAWLMVRKGSSKGELLHNDNVQDGETKTFPLDTPLYINTGRADLTEVLIDDQPIDIGERSGPKRLLISPATDASQGSDSSEAEADSENSGQ